MINQRQPYSLKKQTHQALRAILLCAFIGMLAGQILHRHDIAHHSTPELHSIAHLGYNTALDESSCQFCHHTVLPCDIIYTFQLLTLFETVACSFDTYLSLNHSHLKYNLPSRAPPLT
ncbi:MAG: hypothetical protein U0Y96_11900 [Candidatus Kapaibacterium sp.]|nr:hypothetical protein [Bacteroidota bacterium]